MDDTEFLNEEDQEMWRSFCETLDNDAPNFDLGQESFEDLLNEISTEQSVKEKGTSRSTPQVTPQYITKPSQPKKNKKQQKNLHAKDVDANTKKRLRRGKLDIKGIIDLHGFDRYSAYDHLKRFIAHHYNRGSRVVLVITGKGVLSPDGIGVIKQNLPTWLKEGDLSHMVLDFTLARGKDGGAGAFYILLRKK